MFFTSLVPHFLLFLSNYKYLLLFISIVIEGPILMVASGILIHSGFFGLITAFLVIMAGDLFGDVIWYYIGYFFIEFFISKFGRLFGVTPELFDKSKKLFSTYHEKILFISKITIGFGMSLATLMAAGATRISFKKYMIINFLGELILVRFLLSIGFFFGQIYDSISGIMKTYFIIGAFIGLFVFIYYFTRHIKAKILAS